MMNAERNFSLDGEQATHQSEPRYLGHQKCATVTWQRLLIHVRRSSKDGDLILQLESRRYESHVRIIASAHRNALILSFKHELKFIVEGTSIRCS